MRPGSLVLRLGRLAASPLAAGVLLLGPRRRRRPELSLHWPPREPGCSACRERFVIDGHCQLVDNNGVPLSDSLSWQRTVGPRSHAEARQLREGTGVLPPQVI